MIEEIDEAIKELGKMENRTDTICYSELKKAAKLGIEALELVKRMVSFCFRI